MNGAEMKRMLISLVLSTSVLTAWSQVEKRVEVTRDFVPEVAPAERIDIVPEVRDTVKMRPEIDFTITPKAYDTEFSARRFQPATLTYWKPDPHYPFYLKLGAGYPLNSVADFYASTVRADVGYAVGHFNHVGRFSDIVMYDPFMGRTYANDSKEMTFRVGAAGGRFYGRNVLEGDLSYESDSYQRYPYPDYLLPAHDAREVNFESLEGKFRFGSRNMHSGRFGFSLDAAVDYFNDKSQTTVDGAKYRQISASFGGGITFRAGEHGRFDIGLDWNGYYGLRSISDYSSGIISPRASYSYVSKFPLRFKAGVKTYVDSTAGTSSFGIVPDVRLDWHIGGRSLVVPFLQFDGAMRNNSYRELLRRNQYLSVPAADVVPDGMAPVTMLPNTLSYGFHVGIDGHTRSNTLRYRIAFNVDHADNDLYWYNVDRLYFAATTARRTTFTVDGMIQYHPLSVLMLSIEAQGMLYNADSRIENALPSVRLSLGCSYTASRFSVSLGADYVGQATWSVFESGQAYSEIQPGAFLLELKADYRIRQYISVFIEGHNLANQDIYRFLNYREYGIGFTAGVRWMF